MEKRGDFKGRITSINGFSLVGLAAYAAAKDPNNSNHRSRKKPTIPQTRGQENIQNNQRH